MEGRVEAQFRKPSARLLWRVPATRLASHTVAVSNDQHQGSIPQFVWVANDRGLLGSIPQILCIDLFTALGGRWLRQCRSFWAVLGPSQPRLNTVVSTQRV
jgi:hypothetical protein